MKLASMLRFLRGFGIAGIVSFMIVTISLYLYLGITLFHPFITYSAFNGKGFLAIGLYLFAFLIIILPIVSIAIGIAVGFIIGKLSGLAKHKKR